MTAIKINRALLSVSDKNMIVYLGTTLQEYGVDLLSTGGTAKVLRHGGLDVIDVSDFTGYPEIMDGRVKTLHPRVHGGILCRPDINKQEMFWNGIDPIDMVITNLYPFEKAVECGVSDEDCIENIDIGGPAMIRAAAKNYKYVTVVTQIEDYQRIIDELASSNGYISEETRKALSIKVFTLTGLYDQSIANWMSNG